MNTKRLIIRQLLRQTIEEKGVIDNDVEVVDAIHRRAIRAAYKFAPHYDRWGAAYEAAVCKEIRKLQERFSGIPAGSVSSRARGGNEAGQ